MTAPPDTSPETDGLAILGSAIAGRSVRIGHVEPGVPSWTDGLCVYLDPAASHAQRRLPLTVHAALIAAGGLDPAVVRRLGRRPGPCTVLESAPHPDPDSRMPPWNAHALRRPLTRLGTAPGLYRRRPQGDDLDIDAVVESRVGTLSGSTPDETVYLATRRLRRDLSVLILLDISGSVAEPGGGGTPVHEQQRTAAAALMSVLHELGDRVALYAFRSQGRTAVHLVPVKRFDEVFGATVLRRLRGLRPDAYSRLGAAIRHGTTVLRTGGGTGNKLLLVLSDGLAYDHGYERAYGSADARRALAETRQAGIGCLCLTIGASTGDADLAKVFGSAAHIAVPEAGRLAGVIGPLFRHALFSARAGANRR